MSNIMIELNDPMIFYGVKDWVEENIMYSALGLAALNNLSINEEWPDGTIDKSQKTGMITTALSQLFEKSVERKLKEAGVNVKPKADSGGDITINGEPWEIKTSQGLNIQGATHSAQKPPRYIMIKYKLDYDKALSLENNDGLIIKYGVWISESIQPTWWKGKASENNSRTVLRIPTHKGDEINTVIGELVYNRMYCKLINEAF